MSKFSGSDWTQGMIEDVWLEVEKAAAKYGLTYYPPQIEIISSEQMIDNYCSVAMPVMYPHWSYGKHWLRDADSYRRGNSGLAFEVVINSNPSICYIMDSNTLAMQILVLAHAAVGHSGYFKNNYMFKAHTDASAIIDFLIYARDYVMECEKKYGAAKVEKILDAAHALQNNAINRQVPPESKTLAMREAIAQAKEDHDLTSAHFLWDDLITKKKSSSKVSLKGAMHEENILSFIQQHSHKLENWEKNILGIVIYLAQYFYPQMQTQVANEGFATFWHYTLLHDLFDADIIDDGIMLECLASHNAVIAQSVAFYNPYKDIGYDFIVENEHYSGINPYALGFNIYKDIRRICENPTEEDKQYMPHLIGKDWVEMVKDGAYNYVDDSFILQYLSPNVINKLKLMSLKYNNNSDYDIVDTAAEKSYNNIRKQLSDQYSLARRLPNVYIQACDLKGDRIMHLKHTSHNGSKLYQPYKEKMERYIEKLWGHDCTINDY